MRRTRIKFCGMSRAEDVSAAVKLGVDALGFVCVPGSKRFVNAAMLPELLAAAASVQTILLFQDASEEFIESVLSTVPATTLQFHGAETPEFCARFGLPFIKAVPMADQPDLLEFSTRYCEASALLLDSHSVLDRQKTGGSGHQFVWADAADAMRKSEKLANPRRWFLAGGLNAGNVGAGIFALLPYAVDVSSGIEASPGIKSVEKMRAFIESARSSDDTPARARSA